jgi:polyhydroxybutyrate depolymerase
MQKILLCLFLLPFFNSFGQFETREIWNDGEIRSYIIHVPQGYQGESELPLVINMHGFGSNPVEQLAYTRFNTQADLNNFFVVYPAGIEATIPIGTGNHWNAGFDTGVDDIGFINKIIDFMWNEYQIDLSRVYATGMSNGGFMSYTLACELSGRIAAVASVTGALTVLQEESCSGSYAVPVLQFHGTEDEVVPYQGSEFFSSIPDLMNFWAEKHGCPLETVEENLEDDRTTDGSTVTKITFTSCDDVVLYRINNGGHTWPGGAIDQPLLGNTNRDINASALIWEFFSQYQHPDPAPARVITSVDPIATTGRIFPTIFDSHLVIRDLEGAEAVMMDETGKVWKKERIPNDLHTWDVASLASGFYLIRLQRINRPAEVIKFIKL